MNKKLILFTCCILSLPKASTIDAHSTPQETLKNQYRQHIVDLFKDGKIISVGTHFNLTYEERLEILDDPMVEETLKKYYLNKGLEFCLTEHPGKNYLCEEWIRAHAACVKKYVAENSQRAVFAFPLESLDIFMFNQLSDIHNRIKRLEDAANTNNKENQATIQ